MSSPFEGQRKPAKGFYLTWSLLFGLGVSSLFGGPFVRQESLDQEEAM